MTDYLPKLLIIFALGFLFLPLFAEGAITIDNPLKAKNFTELLDAIINFIFYLALGIAPIMILVSGFYFVTATGDPEKIMTAKKIILWTLIGLLIVFSAKGLIKLFRDIFGAAP